MMKRLRIHIFALLLSASCFGSYSACPYGKGVVGDGIGFHNGYGTVGLFASAFCCQRFQPFLDLRVHFLKDHRHAYNGGLGWRFITRDCDCPSAFGMNVFYDYRERCFGDFQQVGLGFEYFVSNIEVRANSYFPIERVRNSDIQTFDDYAGDFIVKCQRRELSLTGFDVEFLGNLFQRGCAYLYIGVGPYYYYNHACDNFAGIRTRFGFQIAQYIALEGVASYDKLYEGRLSGRLVISIPLDCFCSFCCETNFLSRICRGCGPYVFRNELIPTQKGCCWDFNYDDN